MNAFALHAPTDRTALRWIGSAVVIVAVHAGLIAAGLGWYRKQAPAGSEMPAIMVDMAPAATAPEISQQDIAPGPEMQQAEAPSEPPPEPVQPQQMEEQVAPTPPVEKPVVEASSEQKIEPTPPPPEPAKVEPEPPKPPPPEKPRPKPVRAEVKKKPSDTPPAPRTTAPPRAERQAALASAPSKGASAAASASYNQIVVRHLTGFRQYPSSSKNANEQGRPWVTFTLDRSGRLLSSRLLKSSGHSALDTEVVAMVRRAQPFPPFPSDKAGSSDTFDVPIRFK